jgi:SAM-dependent methyltransferase
MSVVEFNPQSKTCLMCGSTNLHKFKADASDTIVSSCVSIVECEECCFAWQYPLGRTEQQSIQYFEDAYANRGRVQSDYFHPDRKRDISNLEFEFLFGLPVEGNSLLDIGAGAGIFAEVAAENGWHVTAVDPALDNTRIKDDPLLTKIKGTAKQLPDDILFDIVTLWDVIEHTPAPLALLLKAQSHLKEGGWLLIETGNYKSGDRLLGGLKHWIYQLDHRWYFSPESIQQILTEMGFTEFIFCDRVLRPDWHGNVEYTEPSWNNLLQSLTRDRHHISVSLSNSSYITKAKQWKKSGLGIFAMAARKL